MEGKRSVGGSSSSSSGSSSSLASKLFGTSGKSSSSSSSGSGLFNSVFAPSSSSVGGRESSRSDIFGPYRMQQDSAGGSSWNVQQNQTADGISRGGQGRGLNFLNEDTNSIYQVEKIDPCSLSSSLYYGGQDICNHHPPGSHAPASSYNRSYNKDGEDSSGGSAIDSRGDWWQGSLYY